MTDKIQIPNLVSKMKAVVNKGLSKGNADKLQSSTEIFSKRQMLQYKIPKKLPHLPVKSHKNSTTTKHDGSTTKKIEVKPVYKNLNFESLKQSKTHKNYGGKPIIKRHWLNSPSVKSNGLETTSTKSAKTLAKRRVEIRDCYVVLERIDDHLLKKMLSSVIVPAQKPKDPVTTLVNQPLALTESSTSSTTKCSVNNDNDDQIEERLNNKLVSVGLDLKLLQHNIDNPAVIDLLNEFPQATLAIQKKGNGFCFHIIEY